MTAAGPLTFAELGERWAEALVLWDRDVASQGWSPVFSVAPIPRLPDVTLSAFDTSCAHAAGIDGWEGVAWAECRCVTWTGEAWITLHAARYAAVRSALRGGDFPLDARGSQMLWFMLHGGCAAEITPSSFVVPYIISGRSDDYELTLAPGILRFLLGGTRLPETGHVIRQIDLARISFHGARWDEAMLGARYVRIDDIDDDDRTILRIRDSEAALAELGPEVPVVEPVRFLAIERVCPHCGRIPERYRVLRGGSHVCLACGRSLPPP